MPCREPRPLRLSVLAALLATLLLGADAPATDVAGADTHRGFGIRVLGSGDRVAKIVGALGGVRVDGLEPGSLGREVKHPLMRRYLRRGDFILRIRVKDVDPEPERNAATLNTAQAFLQECDRVRSVVAAMPGRKATLVFDVFTQAGYNLEDWKDVQYELQLEL